MVTKSFSKKKATEPGGYLVESGHMRMARELGLVYYSRRDQSYASYFELPENGRIYNVSLPI
jgi:hypothetical protein